MPWAAGPKTKPVNLIMRQGERGGQERGRRRQRGDRVVYVCMCAWERQRGGKGFYNINPMNSEARGWLTEVFMCLKPKIILSAAPAIWEKNQKRPWSLFFLPLLLKHLKTVGAEVCRVFAFASPNDKMLYSFLLSFFSAYFPLHALLFSAYPSFSLLGSRSRWLSTHESLFL